ncbi:MAG: 4Fe-4S binding protein [Lachnospiraceae bacterium]|nr:4Fe-4S binding protein [Lachnospiraceae bacterium]
MAHVISDECISCGSCASQCPVGAIHEGDGKFEVDTDACIDCGACESGCPVSAIKSE